MTVDPSPPSSALSTALREERVALPSGLELAVRRGEGTSSTPGSTPGEPGARPFLLVHGLASNARMWDGVAAHLLAAGHPVIAVDLRGHGLSDAPPDGYDTDTCADDLAALIAVLGLQGERSPVVAGQSWGGNVVLSLAARHPGIAAAVCCVDGGWIRLHDRFASFDACWAVLEPPRFDGMRYDDLADRLATLQAGWPAGAVEGTLANLIRTPDGGVRARLDRDHHRSIVRSLYDGDPQASYPLIEVPVLLVPATSQVASADDVPDDRAQGTRDAVRQALALLPRGAVRWYAGAAHDLHAQFPDRLAADLLALAVSATRTQGSPA